MCYAQLLSGEGREAEAAEVLRQMVAASRVSPGFQRRRNRHWIWKARWRLLRDGRSESTV
ncbi:MAG: hypothetical protein R3C10_12805 [Pirellulales bacterium]